MTKSGIATIGDHVKMMSLYSREKDLDKALATYRHIRESHPETSIVKSKVLKLAALLYSSGRMEGIYRVKHRN